MNLTDRSAYAAKCENNARTDYPDHIVRGLALRVTPGGAKSWSLRYRRESDGKRQRITIGTYPQYSLADARGEAKQLMAAVARGEDPAKAAKRVPAAEAPRTVDELVERYLESHAKQKKTGHEDEQMLRNDVLPSLEGVLLKDVKRAAVSAILDKIIARGSPIRANRTFAVIRKVFNFAIEKGYMENSPVFRMKPPSKENSCERILSEDEIRIFWRRITAKAPMRWQMRMLLKLALVTGQRVGELRGATRAEVNFDKAEWIIPKERAKNTSGHLVPLSPLALRLFEKAAARSKHETLLLPSRTRRAYPKTAPAKAMERCQGLFGFKEPATPHDLRRTLGSGLGELGLSRTIQDKVLNHITGDGKISGVYDRYAYAKEKRAALEAWATHLESIVFQKKRKAAVIVSQQAPVRSASPWAQI